MVKIKLTSLAVLFLFLTLFASTNAVTAQNQNIVTTININPIPGISYLPFALGVNHIDKKLYVARFNTNLRKNEILVIDSLSGNFIDIINFPGNSFYSQIEFNHTSRRMYLATLQGGDNKVHVIDTLTNKIVHSITIEDGINEIAVNSMTNRIYVVNRSMVTVTVIDGNTNKIIEVIKLQEDIDLTFRSEGITVNPLTNRIYVLKDSTRKKSNYPQLLMKLLVSVASEIKEKEIIVIDGSTNLVIETVKLNFDTLADVIDPYIINSISSYNQFGSPITASSSSYNMAINPLTNRIYINVHIRVSNSNNINAILVMDTLKNNIINAIDIDETLGIRELIVVNHERDRIYLADTGNKKLKVIDGRSHHLVSEIKIGVKPDSIKVDQSSNIVYITNNNYGNIKIINEKTIDYTPQALTVSPESTVNDSSDESNALTGTARKSDPTFKTRE